MRELRCCDTGQRALVYEELTQLPERGEAAKGTLWLALLDPAGQLWLTEQLGPVATLDLGSAANRRSVESVQNLLLHRIGWRMVAAVVLPDTAEARAAAREAKRVEQLAARAERAAAMRAVRAARSPEHAAMLARKYAATARRKAAALAGDVAQAAG